MWHLHIFFFLIRIGRSHCSFFGFYNSNSPEKDILWFRDSILPHKCWWTWISYFVCTLFRRKRWMGSSIEWTNKCSCFWGEDQLWGTQYWKYNYGILWLSFFFFFKVLHQDLFLWFLSFENSCVVSIFFFVYPLMCLQ